MNNENLKDVIKDRYGKIARGEVKSCCPACGPTTTDHCLAVGYSAEDLALVPEMAILGVGCGNPAALADLKEGEAVLDLGSGAGIDVFLAAKKVGERGRVIGVDLTGEMVARGRRLAQGARLRQRGIPPGRYRASARGSGKRRCHHQQLCDKLNPGQTGEFQRGASGLEARRAHPDCRPGDCR